MSPRNLIALQMSGGKGFKVTGIMYEPYLKADITCIQYYAKRSDAEAAMKRLTKKGVRDVQLHETV